MPWVPVLSLALLLTVGCGSGDDDMTGVPPGPGSADAGASTPPADAAFDPFPSGLACPTISLCTTYEADPRRVPFPETSGGTLQDGLYRAVQGTNIPYGLAIHDGSYSLIFENLAVAHGDIVVAGDKLIMTQHTNCAAGITNSDPAFEQTLESTFKAEGDELITYSGCDSQDPNQCASPTRLLRVESLCDDLDSLYCENGDCSCATFTDGTIPEAPEDDSCEF